MLFSITKVKNLKSAISFIKFLTEIHSQTSTNERILTNGYIQLATQHMWKTHFEVVFQNRFILEINFVFNFEKSSKRLQLRFETHTPIPILNRCFFLILIPNSIPDFPVYFFENSFDSNSVFVLTLIPLPSATGILH